MEGGTRIVWERLEGKHRAPGRPSKMKNVRAIAIHP